MLSIDKLTYRIGPRILFDQAEASIHPGHRVGLVGRKTATDALPPKPEQAMASVHDDVEYLKEQTSR